MGAFLCPLPQQYLVSEWISANCGLRDVIFTLVLTHPNTPLLASLLDLLGVDLAAQRILHRIENGEMGRNVSVKSLVRWRYAENFQPNN
jgi:hypothetical protein